MTYRLLIVPGDNEALRALQGQLADDVEVRVLDTANDALWEVRNSPPEVIIANLNLPGMSGLDLAEILPNFGVSTKVVLWSRQPNRHAVNQASSHGVYRFLNGPIDLDELQNVLYEALGRTQQSSGAETPTVIEEPPSLVLPDPPEASKSSVRSEPLADRPRRERSAASPSTSTPSSTTTPSSVSAPSSTPAEPTPTRRQAVRRREGPLVLTADNLTPIRSRMEALSKDVGSQCILLTDQAGMMLTEVGTTARLPMMILLPLLSTSFSTAGQISQVLREEESTALYMQEGTNYDLYCFDVLQRFMMVLVFDKTVSTAKIGPVWVYAKRAIRDIQEFLS